MGQKKPATEGNEPATGSTARRSSHRPRPEVATKAPTKRVIAASGARSVAAKKSTKKPAKKSQRTTRSTTTSSASAQPSGPRAKLHAVPDPTEPPRRRGQTSPRRPIEADPAAGGPSPLGFSGPAGLTEAVTVLANVLRVAAQASGVDDDEVERWVASVLAFLRRRTRGDYEVDDFGFDEDFTANVWLPLLRPVYRRWFRVETRGIENIPSTGGALVVANHSGTVAIDSLMASVAVHDEHPAHRHLRMLGADLVFRSPVVGMLARRSGTTLATNPDAERLLSAGEVVGVWPEGFKGVGKSFGERYKLQRFGRGGFVSAALRTGVPIIPCSIVGAEEIYPMIANLGTVARLLGVPYFPITPFFPLLGPLGLIPLPSKWIIEFGEPIETDSLGPAAADDPMLVFDLTDQVRETIQQSLYALLMQRRSVFFS